MQIKDFIVCEDIRQEEHQKVSLMGVFNDEIQLFGLPEPLPAQPAVNVAAYIRIDLEGGPIPDHFALRTSLGGATLMEGGAPLVVKNPAQPVILIVKMPLLLLPSLGTLLIEVTLRKGGEQLGEVISKEVAITLKQAAGS